MKPESPPRAVGSFLPGGHYERLRELTTADAAASDIVVRCREAAKDVPGYIARHGLAESGMVPAEHIANEAVRAGNAAGILHCLTYLEFDRIHTKRYFIQHGWEAAQREGKEELVAAAEALAARYKVDLPLSPAERDRYLVHLESFREERAEIKRLQQLVTEAVRRGITVEELVKEGE